MTQILVSDASVLIDLERGDLVDRVFRLPWEFAVPDLLYDRELKDFNGPELCRLGLKIEALDGPGVDQALAYQRRVPALSIPDTFALSLAKNRGFVLLTGDQDLRHLATSEAVECHGVLWMIDQMNHKSAASIQELHNGLQAISTHPRCRLPKRETAARLKRFAAILEKQP